MPLKWSLFQVKETEFGKKKKKKGEESNIKQGSNTEYCHIHTVAVRLQHHWKWKNDENKSDIAS